MRTARFLVFALVLAAACGGEDTGPSEPPHVLVLVWDTVRADRLGPWGAARPTSPRLDEFVKDAVVFEDCWTTSCWTAPSHASLFTGLRPEHHGLTESVRQYLEQGTPVLAQTLGAAGWRTAGFSNNDFVGPENGLARGFERFDRLYAERREYPMARETHRRALEWMKERDAAGERFFVFVNDMEPHMPYTPEEATAKRFLAPDAPPDEVESARTILFPTTLGVNLGEVTWSPLRLSILSDLYDAEIATLDDEVGRFLDAMRDAKLLDRTLVVMVSDHGENIGHHGLVEHVFSLHRSLLHVPLVMRLPGRLDGGRRDARVVRMEDVMPSVLDACGVAGPEGLDGSSLLGAPSGAVEQDAKRVARAVFGPTRRHVVDARRLFPSADISPFLTGWRSVYDGRHHLIVRTDGKDELFDVEADPAEERNLVGQDPALEERLRALLPVVR